ncbi:MULTISPECIES: hypothetical protein [unclassified Modestobacter]|uniref:hypothetical protein n=1 Tax=unclassified Modestobacter TaxID=2643866 RepID=UPI0022AACB25|nr:MULTISPECIES: hypothetical protein [unclassified Modestobacter]MCZ2811977.1 hypothetical protein [Modestobacter sp. VKM Ac-2979]MCZ2843701.1 hypothetical protein [Modestobacter sp. VKM Ac-2980]MCZ2849876.1 hypothetical protein [Modestobacter sp. VKM Ac-2978]
MSIVVTVNIKNADQARMKEVDAKHPELREKVIGLLKKHGNISHTRLVRDDEVLDIDEWPDEESLRAFLAEAGGLIAQLAELRGTATPEDTIWQKP